MISVASSVPRSAVAVTVVLLAFISGAMLANTGLGGTTGVGCRPGGAKASSALITLEEVHADMSANLTTFPGFVPGQEAPFGWLTQGEMETLYGLAYYHPGPILERGSFAGRSTSVLAMGVRDAGDGKALYSNDIFPADASFVRDGIQPAPSVPFRWAYLDTKAAGSNGSMIGFYINDIPVDSWSTPEAAYKATIAPWVGSPGGQLHWVYSNLFKQKVLDYVVIVAGVQLPQVPYRLQFSDTSHSEHEIKTQFPAWAKLLSADYPVSFAFHDTWPHYVAIYLQLFRDAGAVVTYHFQVDSLFVVEAQLVK